MFCKEARQGMAMLWSVLFCLTKTIQHDDTHGGGYLPCAGESVQWFQDALDHGLAGAGIAAGQGEHGLDGLVRL